MRDAGFKARKKKTDVQITCHGFASYPYLSQALALRMSLMSFFTLSHQESEPNIATLISQKKLRLRETKSPPSVLQLVSSGARRQAQVSDGESLGPLPPALPSVGRRYMAPKPGSLYRCQSLWREYSPMLLFPVSLGGSWSLTDSLF